MLLSQSWPLRSMWAYLKAAGASLSRLSALTLVAVVHRLLSTMYVTAPPVLSVAPSRALVDEAFRVRVKNLPAGVPVTLHSLHRSENQDHWEAYGHYISDHTGTVSVPDDVSLGGTYTGKEAMGLLWSMRPVPGSREGLRLRVTNVCSPMLVNISVYKGHVDEGFMDQDPLASVLAERWYMAPGVQRTAVREKGVRGTLFIPPGPGPFPGLLDMWGGGGGLVEYRAALLASHGFVTLALEYFSIDKDLGTIEFGLFESAFNLIKDHPQVIQDRVGIIGLSIGSALTLSLAALSTVDPRCCVCVSGNHFKTSEGLRSLMEHLSSNLGRIRVDEQNREIWRGIGEVVLGDPEKKVDAGRIKCPVLLINGHDDQNWPSVECSEDVERMMRAAGNDHLLTVVNYPGAGHLIEPPYSPHFRTTNFMSSLHKQKVVVLWGGQTKPHSDAQEDSWKKILVFLEQNLYCSPSPKARL